MDQLLYINLGDAPLAHRGQDGVFITSNMKGLRLVLCDNRTNCDNRSYVKTIMILKFSLSHYCDSKLLWQLSFNS